MSEAVRDSTGSCGDRIVVHEMLETKNGELILNANDILFLFCRWLEATAVLSWSGRQIRSMQVYAERHG